jgi:undecaprenyl-diphosphatase
MPLDIWLFYAINHGWTNPLFDVAMPIITSTEIWRPVYGLAILFLVLFGGSKGRWCAAALLVGVAIADPASNYLLKEPIGRLRPFVVLPDVLQRSGSGGGSFPSNHALNNAMAAVILSWHLPRWAWLWWTVAGAVMISRVYVGVHWPSDVVAGAVIGSAWGWVLLYVMKRLNAVVPERIRYEPKSAS